MFACLRVCVFACLRVCVFACLRVCVFACVAFKIGVKSNLFFFSLQVWVGV